MESVHFREIWNAGPLSSPSLLTLPGAFRVYVYGGECMCLPTSCSLVSTCDALAIDTVPRLVLRVSLCSPGWFQIQDSLSGSPESQDHSLGSGSLLGPSVNIRTQSALVQNLNDSSLGDICSSYQPVRSHWV